MNKIILKIPFLHFLLFFISLFLTRLALAHEKNEMILQILHTNDLHGFFDHTVKDKNKGGFAALKRLIEAEKASATEEGIHTLLLDAGDFMEGSLYYLADNGKKNMEMMNQLGYDAVVIGNHDWLMGTAQLENILKETPPQFHFLGANFKLGKIFSDLDKMIKDSHIFEIGDFKVGIFGLTTNEVLYSWRVQEGNILQLKNTSKSVLKKMAKEKVDATIALTHVGFKADKKFVQEVEGLDLVVGGHSHQAFKKPNMVKDLKGRAVPVVQAGFHAEFLGKLRLKIIKGERPKLLSYELLPVLKNIVIDDTQIKDLVLESEQILKDKYSTDENQDWLNEQIAISEIDLIHFDGAFGDDGKPIGNQKSTILSELIVDSIKEVTKADIAVHSANFGGADLPAGPITRAMVFNAYPRVFDFEDTKGWYIWDVRMFGFFLKYFVKFLGKEFNSLGVHLAGMSFDLLPNKNGNLKVKNILINGEKVKPFKMYHVALPEGIVRGGEGISKLARYVLRQIYKTPHTVWETLMAHMTKLGTIKADYSGSSDNLEFSKKEKSTTKLTPYRTYIPPHTDVEFIDQE